MINNVIINQNIEKFSLMSNINVYDEFVAENIRFSYNKEGRRDPKSYLSLTDAYINFKSWFRDAFPDDKIPNRFRFRDGLISKFGKMNNKSSWPGLRLLAVINDKDDKSESIHIKIDKSESSNIEIDKIQTNAVAKNKSDIIYLVNGKFIIGDTQYSSLFGGVFSELELAKRAVIEHIGDDPYSSDNELTYQFSRRDTRYCHKYYLWIVESTMNKSSL